jgi:hypothetical protein
MKEYTMNSLHGIINTVKKYPMQLIIKICHMSGKKRLAIDGLMYAILGIILYACGMHTFGVSMLIADAVYIVVVLLLCWLNIIKIPL